MRLSSSSVVMKTLVISLLCGLTVQALPQVVFPGAISGEVSSLEDWKAFLSNSIDIKLTYEYMLAAYELILAMNLEWLLTTMFLQSSEREEFSGSPGQDDQQNNHQSEAQILSLPPQPRGLFDACTRDWNSMPFFLEEEQKW